jgi:menaquinone-specific isochorismate synthase
VTDTSAAVPTGTLPALTVETRAVDHLSSLLPLLDAHRPLLFLRRGEGVIGLGERLRLEFRGSNRVHDAAEVWRELAGTARVDDQVRRSGSGLVGFGAFSFDETSQQASVLIVPEVIVGRRDGVSWVTRIDGSQRAVASTPLGPEYRLGLHPGAVDPARYRAIVTDAIGRIRGGALQKAVLARDLVGHLPEGADLRRVLMDLALGYPDTWTYSIDGLLGSSPETLVRVQHGTVTARVLAGSIARGADADADHAAAVALATSTKDLDEHRYAVQSVLEALRPHARGIAASELPFTLKLPNLWHLASDVEGALSDGSTALDLAAALHPTAAVAGTPTDKALALIRELEHVDRRRYGGPVGWVDGNGDGKWGVAVRGAEISADGTITAYAGAGILADSNADQELAETTLKFRPIVEAFG